MYTVIPWSLDLDLTEFYTKASAKGFVNNANKKMLVDSLAKEKDWQVWILYYNNNAIGSVGAHSFPEMGEDAFRIAVRTCVFTNEIFGTYGQGLRTVSVITDHQNPTAQFLIPACIAWTPPWANLYITSNESSIGTQRGVHNVFGPALERKGLMKKIKKLEYRGHVQTVWQLYPDIFLRDLEKYPKW
jgi:hypothetical protein